MRLTVAEIAKKSGLSAQRVLAKLESGHYPSARKCTECRSGRYTIDEKDLKLPQNKGPGKPGWKKGRKRSEGIDE